MPTVLTDPAIAALIAEPKPIPKDYKTYLLPRHIPNHVHLNITRVIEAPTRHRFRLIARKSPSDPMNFSIGLQLLSGEAVGLIRCNGWHNVHFNRLERGTPEYEIPANTFHIHSAKERYLNVAGKLEEIGFASPTGEYHSFETALEYYVATYGFVDEIGGSPFPRQPILPGFK